MIILHKIVKTLLAIITFGLSGLGGMATFRLIWRTINNFTYPAVWQEYTLIPLLFFLGVMSLIFHIRSFAYIKKTENIKTKRNIHSLLWICAYGIGLFILIACCWGFYEEYKSPTGEEYIYAALFGVLSLSLIFIIEVKATYNKYLEANRPSEQDIAEIGNV